MSPGITRRDTYALYAQSNRWLAVLFTFYPVEFLFLVAPKLMLLGRLANNAIRCNRAHIRGTSGFIGGLGQHARAPNVVSGDVRRSFTVRRCGRVRVLC
jgi:hypothetical protein